MISEHKGRADFALTSAIGVAQSLGKMFDDYTGKVLSDLEEEIGLLESVDFELDKEKKKLKEVRMEFEETNGKLNILLQNAKDGRITSFSDFDFTTVLAAWKVVKEVEGLRSGIDRFNRKHIRDMEAFRELFDQALRERGL